MLGNPMQTSYVVNQIMSARNEFRQRYVAKGLEQTQLYLNRITGLRKFFAEYALSKESNEFHGAKQALNDLLKNK